MVFCPQCGHQNSDEAAFCGGCGTPLKARIEANAAAAPAADATAPMADAAQTGAQPTAPVQPAQDGNTAEMPNAAAPAAAPAAAAPAPAPAPAYAPTPGAVPPPAVKPANRTPIIIGAAVVVLAAILLIVLLVIPRCSGGVAGGLDMKTLVTGKTSEAQAVLSKMNAVELGSGSSKITVYASNDKMKSFAEDLFDDLQNGNVKEFDDVINKDKAKEISGQWLLVSTADESFEQILDMASSRYGDYDLGHMAAYFTVVTDDDLTNEEAAKIVSSAGIAYEHAVVGDVSTDNAFDFIGKYMETAMNAASSAYGGSSRNSSAVADSLQQARDTIDEYGLKRVGEGTYMGKDIYAASVSVQFDGYAIVGVVAFSPKDFGLDTLLGEDFLKRLYVK